jgi:hypothetical protein
MTNIPDIGKVKDYFNKRIQEFGASPRGADWNSDSAQNIRFEQLLKVVEGTDPVSLLDYGCGWGAMADYLKKKGLIVNYYGYDILENAIVRARQVYARMPSCVFTTTEEDLPICDYVVASGLFNFRGDQPIDVWTDYVVSTLERFDKLSQKGFSSNFLTKYSDVDKMRADLYYADPLFLFDYCKKNFSKNVALLHDYRLYDFTILVRKD